MAILLPADNLGFGAPRRAVSFWTLLFRAPEYSGFPVTLADGRTAQLFIPARQANQPHAVYLRDADGLHPVRVKDHVTRDEITRSPAVIEKQAEPSHANKRSWEKEAMIIGGSAGAGTAIGAVAGGKKGAGIGAATGGVGGLLYDLITRDQK